uniref:Peptidase M48 domain-containing protein n=1 Tax=candidate division WOR-3 bacterium TaxID=2052148 RepID=A0A7V3VVA3_UNCW3
MLWRSGINIIAYCLYSIGSEFFSFRNISDVSAFPAFLLIFLFISFFLKPISNAISRYFEKIADYGALTISNNPQAFIRLMARFCNEERALTFHNPIFEFYSYSHPSIGKRIKSAERFLRMEGE